MIKQLIAALADAGVETDAETIADAFWLARARLGGQEGGERPPGPVIRPESTEPRPPDAEPRHPADGAETATAAARGRTLDRPVTAGQAQAARGQAAGASSITLRRARELPEALELGRALRPLKQRHPSKRDLALDAEGTVAYFCDTGVLTPVMRPGAERWFDVDVLVDDSPSMAVWQDTGLDLVSLLQRHGAFREVRHWTLRQVEGKVRLSGATGLRSEAPQLVDPATRRLTMVVTDCVAPMWYQAPIWDAIRQWGLFSPVVITSMLPTRLWAQTALGSPDVVMRSHQAGSANGRLDVTVPWWWPDDVPPRSAVPVPVITLEAGSVAAWARMVMGAGGVETAGVFAVPPLSGSAGGVGAAGAAGGVGAAGAAGAAGGAGGVGAEERVQRFQVTVSATAYRLAVYMSAALRGPWGLSLARVVQDALLPDSGQVHLAEVIVGGLVRRADQDAGTYEFVEGVADVLRRSLTATEALRVLQALGGHIERETGRSPGIAAMLLGEAPPADTAEEFGEVRAGAAGLIQAMGLARLQAVDLDVTVGGVSAAPASDVTAPADEVTLLVRSDGPRHTFQLLSQQYMFEPVIAESSLAEASQLSVSIIEQLNRDGGRKWLEELGTRLWLDVVPAQIRDQFWQLRPGISSFAIAADRELVPWELLYPRGSGHDEGFLVEQFPVTRLVYGQQRSRRIGVGRVTPVLLSPWRDVRDEAAAIGRILGQGDDTPVIDDSRALVNVIGSGRAGSLYFTGHARVTTRLAESEIAMTGGPLSPIVLGTALSRGGLAGQHPLVFVNAWRGSGERAEPTRIADWAQQFMTAGAGAFVGTSWTVPSDRARTFAEAFYQALRDGHPLGEAARRARLQASRDSSDPAWLAYAVFGDPAAVADLERDAPKSRPTPPTPPRPRPGRTGSARIVAVHGLGQQMSGEQVLRSAWLPPLRDGLARAGAEPVASEDLAIAFYGDLFRPVSDAAEPDAEPPLDEELVVPLWRAAASREDMPGPEQASGSGGKGFVQRALRALNTSRFFTGLSERAMIGELRQLRTYLHEAAARQAVLDRVADTIGPQTRVIVAHSIGSIVAYEALCAHPEWDIRMFVTLGSPLGWRYVFDRLIPPPENGIGSWPGNTRQWTNIADTDDIVALEKRLAPLFAGPVGDVLVDNGARAHDLNPYLTAAETGRAIAAGLTDLAG